MFNHGYSYESALSDALKVNWKIEDLIGGDKQLDFSRPFLPEKLAGVRSLSFLSEREKLLVNQIRGNSYLHLFRFVEEFILPFVLDQARGALTGDSSRIRALLTFAEEEAKHMHLFRRFAEEFAKGFGVTCGVIGSANEVSRAVLSHSLLGVALLILHIEWMTQAHYVDSVKDEQQLDAQFKSLLRHHWMEEAQHAKLDTLMVEELARGKGYDEMKRGFDDFATLGTAIDGLLAQQVALDVESFQKAAGRSLDGDDRAWYTAAQHRSYRYTFLVSGLDHPSFLRTVRGLSPVAAERMTAMARALS